jgi:hypothetical protein
MGFIYHKAWAKSYRESKHLLIMESKKSKKGEL